jgi:hypothetical protein
LTCYFISTLIAKECSENMIVTWAMCLKFC